VWVKVCVCVCDTVKEWTLKKYEKLFKSGTKVSKVKSMGNVLKDEKLRENMQKCVQVFVIAEK
jgi:hypothetical protein